MPDRALKVLQEVFNLRVIQFLRALLRGAESRDKNRKDPVAARAGST